ncbi:MAG: glycosyltransferase family 4 protein [Proteobacteria bacterium]|nr:glycosyltransferase family 4 protein [Pseudomonadota bacterium]
MINVKFLYQDENLPSSRIRVLNLIPYLRKYGINATTSPFPKSIKEKIKVFFSLKHYDIVLLQKKLVTPFDLYLIRKNSKKLFFDFDDAIYINDDTSEQFENKRKGKRFKKIISVSDVIIAGNPILASRAKEFNNNIFVLPSPVFTENIPVKGNPRDNSKPLILGWVGGGSNLHHLKIIIPALKTLSKRIPLILRVLSNRDLKDGDIKIENIKWDLNTQDREISLFDVGLMPIPKNPWTEGKCSYKALQYMASGVVPVATRFGFNCHVIEDKKDGFLFDTDEEFINIIEFIYQNPLPTYEMGKKAREKVVKYFSVEAISQKLAEILKNSV